ncbi:MAG: hypothetical protein DRI94_10975 [Bacteroidetes bacterium]|nr:MAG: hypothetical protein DRI94_10975 [Bacteroidota bacterium]
MKNILYKITNNLLNYIRKKLNSIKVMIKTVNVHKHFARLTKYIKFASLFYKIYLPILQL